MFGLAISKLQLQYSQFVDFLLEYNKQSLVRTPYPHPATCTAHKVQILTSAVTKKKKRKNTIILGHLLPRMLILLSKLNLL